MLKKCIYFFFMSCFGASAYCYDINKVLLQEKAALKQSYLLSENYSYGLTVEKDYFKALAWKYVYVTLLPHAYPGSYSLLEPYKKKVEKDQFDMAFELSKSLKSDYNLPKRMDENQLIRVFESKETLVNKKVSDEYYLTNFDDFLEQVQNSSSETAVLYKNIWHQFESNATNRQLIYGQIIVNGGEIEQTLIRNQPLLINKDGFFIGSINKNLFLTARGYQPYQYSFKASQKTALGLIVLNKYPKNQLASIVGSIFPLKNIKSVALTLTFENQYFNQEQPWLSPTIAVTKLDNGQFYIKGLAPGNYKLILSFDDEKQFIPISVNNGQVKTIKPISL